jgi:hypothetical protein
MSHERTSRLTAASGYASDGAEALGATLTLDNLFRGCWQDKND